MTTDFGENLIAILEATNSMIPVIEYIRDNEYFTDCRTVDLYKCGSLYQIGLDRWTNATGIDADMLQLCLPTIEDGRVWTDTEFRVDEYGHGYRHDEHSCGERFVYIGMDNYNHEFDDDDETVVPKWYSVGGKWYCK